MLYVRLSEELIGRTPVVRVRVTSGFLPMETWLLAIASSVTKKAQWAHWRAVLTSSGELDGWQSDTSTDRNRADRAGRDISVEEGATTRCCGGDGQPATSYAAGCITVSRHICDFQTCRNPSRVKATRWLNGADARFI
jgi:hypothetical protein